ncbi:hypothetical protein ABLE91_18720 [Aquabacter sp. CN5-332]|uniref:hypothetical protein n=1 Tax=Aquabacter sp. CN5-332 TaxID=3156608 RepID=UPI0032B5053C
MVSVSATKPPAPTGPAGKADITAAIVTLKIKQQELEKQLEELKQAGVPADSGAAADQRNDIKDLEDRLKLIKGQVSQLSMKLEMTKSDERKKEEKSGSEAGKAGMQKAEENNARKNPYAPLFKNDLTPLSEETDPKKIEAAKNGKDVVRILHKRGDRDTMDKNAVATALLVPQAGAARAADEERKADDRNPLHVGTAGDKNRPGYDDEDKTGVRGTRERRPGDLPEWMDGDR